jgi:hypothetical protein
VILAFGPETDAGSIVQPEACPLRLFWRYFEPLTTPDALYTLVIDVPALLPEQGCDPAIAVATVLCRQIQDRPRQCRLIVTLSQPPALRRSGLTQYATGTAFGD